MHLTLRFKILLILLIVSFCAIFLTAFSIFFGVESRFSSYLQSSREQNIDVIESEIRNNYEETGNIVSDRLFPIIHEQAMTENMFYSIYDPQGNLLADTNAMSEMMKGMGVHSSYSSSIDYESASYSITAGQETIGSMQVQYPVEFIGEEIAFLESIKWNILTAVLVTVFLAILFSMFFSKRLTTGFTKLSKAIQNLQSHQSHVHVPVAELTDEMKPLGESFNQLSSSLAKEAALRQQFTADIAHELRTPLATLRSQIEAYQDNIWEPTPKRLQQSHDELMRMVRLVNELEELMAAENPQIHLNKTDIEAAALLNFIENQFTPAFEKNGVNLLVQRPSENVWFEGDRDRIIQILTNVMNNALQYTPNEKQVTIKLEDTYEYVGFIIEDEGIGIAEKDLPYLYERFYRGDKSRDRKTGGVGIGLAIVKALIDAHHGKIEIESQIDKGTIVSIWLPKNKT